MDEYIKKNQALCCFSGWIDQNGDFHEPDEMIEYQRIEQLPAADVVPVVHGRWEHHPEIGWGSTWLCSECGEKTVETVMGEPRYKFCPMCGADMRKDGEGNENH